MRERIERCEERLEEAIEELEASLKETRSSNVVPVPGFVVRLLPDVRAQFDALRQATREASASGTGTRQASDRVSTAEAAQRLGVSSRRVRQLRDNGILTGEMIGNVWTFDREQISQYVRRNQR